MSWSGLNIFELLPIPPRVPPIHETILWFVRQPSSMNHHRKTLRDASPWSTPLPSTSKWAGLNVPKFRLLISERIGSQRACHEWMGHTGSVRSLKRRSSRLCFNYRMLKDVIQLDSYPISRIEDCTDVRGKSTRFPALNTNSGYWQLETG